MLDFVLSGALVADGTGRAAFTADVGISGSLIEALGDLRGKPCRRRVDVTGAVVCPGFVDIHSHSDLPLVTHPGADSKLLQGVTTEVVGNCGFSPAPLTDENRAGVLESSEFLSLNRSLDWDWRTMGDYHRRLERQGIGVNVATLVGHVNVRSAVMGFDKRYATDGEVEAMGRLLDEAMAQGCFGMSTGLVYPPSSFADTEELVALASVIARHGGLYFSHIRGEGKTLVRAVAEGLEIGERARIPVQLAHHKAAGKAVWGRVRETLALVEMANARGVDATVDVYPYTAGSSYLAQVVPQWAHEGGKLLDRLRDPSLRERLRDGVDGEVPDWSRLVLAWVGHEGHARFEGKPFSEIASAMGVPPAEAVLRILADSESRASMVHFLMCEDDVRHVLRHPLSMIGSDGAAIAPLPCPLGAGKPHPRYYGCYPRVLGHYVREERVLGLEEAVSKMTRRPARKMGIADRGEVREGLKADLVVFDPKDVRDEATFQDPHRFPRGILHVFVNGKHAVEAGRGLGVLAGEVLRKNGSGPAARP